MTEYVITQLPTMRDKKPCVASTKRRWHGPATILTICYDDGGKHEVEFTYMPDATVEKLRAIMAATA